MGWVDEARERASVEEVAMALGLSVWTKAGARGFPCPEHPKNHSDGRPTARIVRHGAAFWCHKCEAGGDLVTLVALAMHGERAPRGEKFHAVRAWFAERGWCTPFEGQTRARPRPTRAPPRPVERPREPEPTRAPSEQVVAFWGACKALEVGCVGWRWLCARDMAWKGIRVLDLARTIPAGLQSPDWAGFVFTDRRTGEEVRRSWADAGWNLALPCFDSDGGLVAVRARWTGTTSPDWPPVDPERSETYLGFGDTWRETRPPFSGKEVSPRGAGFCRGTVYADPVARWLLEGGHGPVDTEALDLKWNGRVLVVEGGPDFLAMATRPGRVSSDGQVDAVVGVWSGAWADDRPGRAIARRFKGAKAVLVACDDDEGGDRIGRPILRALHGVGAPGTALDWKRVQHG